MGTRVDFYVGRGESAEWLGSYPWDGYPHGVFDGKTEILAGPTEVDWRQWVAHFLAENSDGATWPAQGWPWPWEDSSTTDYAYAYDDGVIYGSCFGHSWFVVDPRLEDWGQDDDAPKNAVFPRMDTQNHAPAGTRRAGNMLIVFGGAS